MQANTVVKDTGNQIFFFCFFKLKSRVRKNANNSHVQSHESFFLSRFKLIFFLSINVVTVFAFLLRYFNAAGGY